MRPWIGKPAQPDLLALRRLRRNWPRRARSPDLGRAAPGDRDLRAPGDWLSRVERDGSGESAPETVERPEQATEYLMMALRLAEGLDLRRYATIAGSPPDSRKIRELSEMGLLRIKDDRLQATDGGRAVLNSVIRELMP